AGLGKDGSIDADQAAVGVNQRAAGVALVDSRVSLDEVLVGVEAQLVAAGGTDNTHGHRLAQAKGVADGHDHIACRGLLFRSDGRGGQVRQIDLEYRQVGLRVGADQFGDGFTAVAQGDKNFVGIGDHVVVGQ